MIISLRTYLFIGIIMGLMIYGFAIVFGDDAASWAAARQAEAAAKNQPVFEQVVFQPLEYLMANDTRLTGAIIAALVWPALFVLLFMVVLGLIILEFIDVEGEIRGSTGALPVMLAYLRMRVGL